MALDSCGPSVQACALRVAALEQDGVPVPGPLNVYTTDAFTSLAATPNYMKGIDLQVPNACGTPHVIYKDRDRLLRYDLTMEIQNVDPEMDNLLVGGELFTLTGKSVGWGTVAAGQIERPYGVSVELWSKHVVNGDFDPIWPYIHWVLPRTYWVPDKVTFDNNYMPRTYSGYTSSNANWFNGPANDWTFSSDRMLAYAFTRTLPAVTCGAQTLVSS